MESPEIRKANLIKHKLKTFLSGDLEGTSIDDVIAAAIELDDSEWKTVSPIKQTPIKPAKRIVDETSLDNNKNNNSETVKSRRKEHLSKTEIRPPVQNVNQPEKTEKKVPTKIKPKPFVIDGIPKKFQNVEAATKEINKQKPEIQIESIRILHKGGILVAVKDNRSFNQAMKEWPNDSFEGQMNIHLTARHDLRPTLCVNKFSIDSDIKSLDKALKDMNIQAQGLRRLINAKQRETTLIIFNVENEDQVNLLKRNGIITGNTKYNVNNYIKANHLLYKQRCHQYC